jgi:hypothetical protein
MELQFRSRVATKCSRVDVIGQQENLAKVLQLFQRSTREEFTNGGVLQQCDKLLGVSHSKELEVIRAQLPDCFSSTPITRKKATRAMRQVFKCLRNLVCEEMNTVGKTHYAIRHAGGFEMMLGALSMEACSAAVSMLISSVKAVVIAHRGVGARALAQRTIEQVDANQPVSLGAGEMEELVRQEGAGAKKLEQLTIEQVDAKKQVTLGAGGKKQLVRQEGAGAKKLEQLTVEQIDAKQPVSLGAGGMEELVKQKGDGAKKLEELTIEQIQSKVPLSLGGKALDTLVRQQGEGGEKLVDEMVKAAETAEAAEEVETISREAESHAIHGQGWREYGRCSSSRSSYCRPRLPVCSCCGPARGGVLGAGQHVLSRHM